MLKMVGKFALVASVAAVMVACGGKNDPDKVATANLSVAAGPVTTSALFDAPLSFATGVPELGTTGATTITFSNNTATPATPLFSIKTADGGEANGTLTFGSCIFTVTKSTTGFITVGQVIRIDPCTVNAKTSGATVGVTSNANVTLLLGRRLSVEVALPLTVSPEGVVTFKGAVLGTVTIAIPSGGGGG